MTDKIPSFKNHIDEIHVPTEKLDDIIFKTVQEHAPKRKGSLRSKFVYSASAAVVALGLLVGSAAVSPAMAEIVSKIPLIGSIFSESEDVGLAQVSELGFTHIVKESKTIGDKTITVDEVFFDGTRFTFSYSFKTKEPVDEFYLEQRLSINGESMLASIGINTIESTPTYLAEISEIQTSAEIHQVYSSVDDLPEDFELGLHFNGQNGEVWDFAIPISRKNNTKLIPIEHTQEVDDIKVSVASLKLSPSGILLTFKSESAEDKFLVGAVDFQIIDSSGKELFIREGYGSSNDSKYLNSEYIFDPVSKDATELTITPYINIPKQGEAVEVLDGVDREVDLSIYKDKEFKFDSFTVTLPK